MNDSGLYTVRIFSKTEKVEDTFHLQVGKKNYFISRNFRMSGNKILT